MPLLTSPSRVVYFVHRFPSNRPKPARDEPTHRMPSASINREEILSLGSPSCLRITAKWSSRNRQRPPPPVPIHRLPAASSAIDCTASDDKPSRVLKTLQPCSSRRANPPRVPTHKWPRRS